MHSGNHTTLMKEETQATEDAILRDEWGARFASEKGVNCSMVVQVEVNREVTAKGRQRDGFHNSEQFSSLLRHHPSRARKEPRSHLALPNACKESAPG